MLSTVSAVSESSGARAVLSALRSLRYFKGTSTEFWAMFAHNAGALCRSVATFCLLRDGEDLWRCVALESPGVPSEASHTLLMQQATGLAQRAVDNGFAFVPVHDIETRLAQPVLLVVALDTGVPDTAGLIALVLDRRQGLQFNEAVVRMQLIADVPAAYVHAQPSNTVTPVVNATSSAHALADVLDLMALLTRQRRFVSACMLLVNELASRYQCTRVSIGWKKGDYVVPVAISHMERFEAESDVCQALQHAYDECYDQDEELLWPQSAGHGAILAAHGRYAERHKCVQILSLPLRHEMAAEAILTLERMEGEFSPADIAALRLMADQVTPWLRELHRRDRWLGGLLMVWLKDQLQVWLGPERTLLKLGSLVATLLVLYVSFGTWDYRIDVTATLETDNVAFMTAPFDGYVHSVEAHEGDRVEKGNPLLRLDTEELLLKQSEALADVNRYSREAEKARAANANADMRVAQARVEQAQASLERVRYFLQQAMLVAPFTGVVVEGDKEKLLGAPLSKGDVVFKVAQISDLYVKLQVDEVDVSEVQVGNTGTLALLSRPELRIPIEVIDIVPVADVKAQHGNVFVLKARFPEGAQDWWRPGMSGLAKIDVGERNILWILTHRVADFLRMRLWW